MSEFYDRLRWVFYRRLRLQSKHTGFWASCRSYATADCQFADYNRIYRRSYLRSSSIGRMSYIAENSRVGFTNIGTFCSIGPNISLGGMGWHPNDGLSTHPAFYSSTLKAGKSFIELGEGIPLAKELPITKVGNDVWMGVGCTVLDGVQIGDGAIIAAGAVVTKDVPDYAIVGGVPARIIRYRFDEETIATLLAWRWWDLPYAQIEELVADFKHPSQMNPALIEQWIAKTEISNQPRPEVVVSRSQHA